MNKERMHFVPQPVIDCAENLATTKQDHMRENYIQRLETIRDYCDYVLKTQSQVRWTPPASGKHSRIGRNSI